MFINFNMCTCYVLIMEMLLIIVVAIICLLDNAKDSYYAARFQNSDTLEQKYPHTWRKK